MNLFRESNCYAKLRPNQGETGSRTPTQADVRPQPITRAECDTLDFKAKPAEQVGGNRRPTLPREADSTRDAHARQEGHLPVVRVEATFAKYANT